LIEIFIPELLIILLIKEVEGGYKFRFSRWIGDSKLTQFISTSLVTIVIIISYLLSNYIFGFLIGKPIEQSLHDLNITKLLSLIIALFSLTFVFIRNGVLKKKLDLITLISVLIFVIGFLISFL